VKVGDGRGFIIQHRWKLPKLPPLHLEKSKLRQPVFAAFRLVVTAAHCLPKLPRAFAAAPWSERTYKGLLGTLDGSKSGIWAECLFADPAADIAVVGCPDTEQLDEQADAYYALTDDVPALRIDDARSGPGWMLSLDGRWVAITLEVRSGLIRAALAIDANEAGMSGSPVLNKTGRAVGVITVGSERVSKTGERINQRAGGQPILTLNLPRWVLT
jgi:hypothetical protein